LSQEPDVDKAIAQMTSIDKFIACLMLAERICFHGKTPRFYKNEETIRKKCPPKVKQFFSLNNLKRLGVVYQVPKGANLYALEGFGIRVAKKLYVTGEAKKVYELYGEQHVPL
jgi:hypothetical protein